MKAKLSSAERSRLVDLLHKYDVANRDHETARAEWARCEIESEQLGLWRQVLERSRWRDEAWAALFEWLYSTVDVERSGGSR